MTQTWADQSSVINVNELTEQIRIAAQPMKAFAQAASGPDGRALGKGRGDTVQYVFYPDVDTQGGELDENEEFPSTGFTPAQVSYTLAEYGNSIKHTGKLEDLSRLGIRDVHMQALLNDWHKLENTQVRAQAITTDWQVALNSTTASSEFVTDGTLTATTNADLSLDGIGFTKTKAKLNKIPFYDGESYLFITGVEGVDALQNDADFQDYVRYDSGRAALNGELGRVRECRIVEDNHVIAKSTGTYDEFFLFGADAVGYDVGCPIEIRTEVKDIGRSLAIAYYTICAWYKVMDQTSHSQEHIIYGSSA
jgi:N4-gp56 family major capsid protein